MQRCLPAVAVVYTAVLAHQRNTTKCRTHSTSTVSAVLGATQVPVAVVALNTKVITTLLACCSTDDHKYYCCILQHLACAHDSSVTVAR
jgi:hypothetical protein